MNNSEFFKKYLEIISEEKTDENKFEEKKVKKIIVELLNGCDENIKNELKKRHFKEEAENQKDKSLGLALKIIRKKLKGIGKFVGDTGDRSSKNEVDKNDKINVEVNASSESGEDIDITSGNDETTGGKPNENNEK